MLKALGQQRWIGVFQGGGERRLYGDEEQHEVRRSEALELRVALRREALKLGPEVLGMALQVSAPCCPEHAAPRAASQATRVTLASITTARSSGSRTMTSGRLIRPLSSRSVSCFSYSCPALKPEASRTRSRISSPQFPCSFLSPRSVR